MYIDLQETNFNLNQDSPCIDAGDPDLPYDSDNTITDMGAFFYNQNPNVIRNPVAGNELPANYYVSVYPNPFNNVATVRYNLQKSGFVTLIIYDTNGREVSNLIDDWIIEGTHEVKWKADEFPSGVYIAKLFSERVFTACKLLLIK